MVFEAISIWGRIAYCICCLENYVISRDYPKEDWKMVFAALWSFSSAESYDDWFYRMTEYLPDCVLEFKDFDSPSEWEYIDETVFTTLRALYSRTTTIDDINDIMHVIHDICGCELYTTASPPALDSLLIVEGFLRKAQTMAFRLPDINLFTRFAIAENRCWGAAMERADIEIAYQFA